MRTHSRSAWLGSAVLSLSLVLGACDDGGQPAPQTVAAPTFTPDGGSFTSSVEVALATATGGAAIRYTTDGSNPTETTGTPYSAPFTLDTIAVHTVKAIAYEDGMTSSAVVARTFAVAAPGQVAAPIYSPDPGSFDAAQNVSLSSATQDAAIHYTMTSDGSDPGTPTAASTPYTAAIALAQPPTENTSVTYRIKAMAVKSGMTDSSVSSAEYVIRHPGTPVSLTETFEDEALGFAFGKMAWNPAELTAVVADDPLATGNHVLHVTQTNYNAAPVIVLQLPAGKTLADYSAFTFRGYFASGDVGWKHLRVYAYGTAPTGSQAYDAGALGDYNREREAGTTWENITLDISANTSTLAGTVYLAFGFNGDDAVWYADDVALVE